MLGGSQSPPGLELKFKFKKCVGLGGMFDKVRGNMCLVCGESTVEKNNLGNLGNVCCN